MRAKSAGARSEVADGPVLKHNVKNPMQDPRVPLLREKFGLPGDASDLAYDAKLAAAVRKFQQANELPASGNLDARTVKESDGLDARRYRRPILPGLARTHSRRPISSSRRPC
jgi:peptidoglycan hydrolase-like protein with peptidoglycan-binding domain